MYLRALEIQGFKSFPDKTRLTFEKDITAIVGPNGSGKSNISDAILWVMGEQRSKALRGGKMEDVIFGGTEKRSSLGFAQVSLVIDNSERIFDSESMEIMITRRYYRSGESEYYLNRQSVRLKDIKELLMDTGLGRDGYSIIGQGKIGEIVSAKGTDRREIFEEAAGISRYRYRKDEAERKLERTRKNLLRVNDKIDELEMQVGPLREQAEVAKKYLIFRDELRALEISVWMETLDKLKIQAEAVNAEYEQAKSNLELAHKELEATYARTENLTQKMREKDIEADNYRALLSQAESSVSECESAVAVLKTNMRNNNESLERISRELAEQEGRTRGLEAQIEERRLRVQDISRERDELESRAAGIIKRAEENEACTGEAQLKLTDLIARESELNGILAQSETMLSMLADSAQELMDRDTAIKAETAAALERYEQETKRLREDRRAYAGAKEKYDELNNVINGYKIRLSGREAEVAALSDKQTRLIVDLRSMDARISMLTEMEKEFEGFSKSVKTVMREARRGTLRGIHGPVARLLKTDEKFTLAIETALGASMQSVVVDTPEVGKAAIELLKSRDAGRGTFLPISAIKPNGLSSEPAGEEGYLGTAFALVRCDEKYENIFKNLLGRTVIAETLGDAVRMAKKHSGRFRIVTLDGQVMNAGGSMTGGSSARNAGILSRASELKRLREQRVKLSEREEKGEAELAEAQRELSAVRYELEVAQTEFTAAREHVLKCEAAVSQGELLLTSIDDAIESIEREAATMDRRIKENERRITATRGEATRAEQALAGVSAEIMRMTEGRKAFELQRQELMDSLSGLRSGIASLDAEKETILTAISQLEALKLDIAGDRNSRAGDIKLIEDRNRGLGEELALREARLKVLNERTESLKLDINGIVNLRLELEGKRTQAEKAGQEKNRALLDMERQCAKLEQKKLAADMEEKQIIDKLWDSYELSHSAARQLRQPVESLAKSNRRISELKRAINSLGNPNLGAIEEFERVNARYTFLTEQRDDVEKSKRELEKIIAEITREMEEIFIREFKAIDESFRTTFLELFGGGRAALALEDEEDVLNCGIEIKVQPPGKALSTLSLLSGGEMAFVAIALYFAILKVRPTPFCVMDEIEAALDEANVIRYAEYMRTMTTKTQFIVITHRRGTMEEADMLYGVTMQEKGVSSVISVDLEEAEKTIA